jgi:hypothetical protein
VRSFAGHVLAIRAATEGRQGAPLLEHCGVVRLIEINLAFWSMGAALAADTWKVPANLLLLMT